MIRVKGDWSWRKKILHHESPSNELPGGNHCKNVDAVVSVYNKPGSSYMRTS